MAQSLEISAAEDLDAYRQIGVELGLTDLQSNQTVEFRVDGDTPHSTIMVADVSGLQRVPVDETFQACFSEGAPVYRNGSGQAIISAGTTTLRCALTGMQPGQDHEISAVVRDAGGALSATSSVIVASTKVPDVRLLPPDTRPILYLLGSILLSLVFLLSGLRWWDIKRGNLKSKNAYLYVGPAIIALVLLTFYPIVYGVWLSFTDANQTRLGEASFVGLSNFLDVLTSSGLVQVGLFTLFWTVVNVFLHVTLGLLLAVILNRSELIGRNVYRTILLLPWAVPAYISVLAWQGM
ncbi:MAG: sugar ABC transporter permease, partial [Pseudomonadota bacterium]